MALDPSIILAAVPNIDVQGERLKRQNVKDAVLGNEINQYKLNQAKQADTRTSNLRDIFSQNADDMLPGALKEGGYIDEYNAFNKQKQEQAQGTLKNREVELNNAKKKIDLSGQAMGALMQNPTDENLQNTLKGLVQNGVMTPEEAQAAYDKGPKDPEGIKALATQHYQSALDTKDQLEKFTTHNTGQQTITQGISPVTGATRTVGTLQNTQDPNSVASVANQAQQGELNRQVQMRGQDITARGQNMTDLRARERNNIDSQFGKAPSGYRFNADGSLQAISGGPGDKSLNPTESQGKAALFSNRALEADKILGTLAKEGTVLPGIIKQGAETIPVLGGALGMGINTLPGILGGPSGAQQQVEQAQRDFVNAVLRQESGAAIGQGEFDNARKQYFPQPGDTKKVIAQKASNRQTAIKGLNTMAGPAGRKGGASGSFEIGAQLDSLPDPKSAIGKTIRDDDTGIVYKSDGKSWSRI